MPVAQPAAPTSAREAFLALVRAANLFAPMQLARVEAAVPADAATPAEAARRLVEAGHLTRFQAQRLLAGHTDGFHLGPYVILEQVGCGAAGRVYKARHLTMNRPVAVKVLTAEFTRTAAREAILAEVRGAAQLNHPNIVTAYDANELTDRFYVVLEFVDGPNFETLVQERGPLPAAEACGLARQAAEGLAHAHARGMTHRDLKPANLLVARPSKSIPEPLVKIADFGLAKLTPALSLSQTPAPGALESSLAHAAPEMALHPQAVDHRADLYSLGSVLYFLLAGRPPLPAAKDGERARRGVWQEPARIETVRPDVPPALAELVHQMLAKDPAHRPASAEEVSARLMEIAIVFGQAVSFDLPPSRVWQYPGAAGQLSGGHPMPDARVPTAAACDPVPDTSPWGQLTPEDTFDETDFELADAPRRPRRRKRGLSPLTMGVLAASMVALCILSINVLVKLLK
jgi:serine/threonine-protein kinase